MAALVESQSVGMLNLEEHVSNIVQTLMAQSEDASTRR